MRGNESGHYLDLNTREQYELLERYYHNNRLYRGIHEWLRGRGIVSYKKLKSLRNPANRIVEYYAARLFPKDIEAALDTTPGRQDLETVVEVEAQPAALGAPGPQQLDPGSASTDATSSQTATTTEPPVPGGTTPAAEALPELMGNALPVEILPPDDPEEDPLREMILLIYEWSNFRAVRRVWSRRDAMLGEIFIKVEARDHIDAERRRVYWSEIHPGDVTEMDKDERDNLTYIRMDVHKTRRNLDGELEDYWHTEVWDKANFTHRVWHHDRGPEVKLADLPVESLVVDLLFAEEPLVDPETNQAALNPDTGELLMPYTGFDFIPIKHIKFRDVGNARGEGAYSHILEDIDEINSMVTNLHDLMFRHNRPKWALESGMVSSDGRPLDAPDLDLTEIEQAELDEPGGELPADDVDVGKETLVRLPGISKLASLIPNINFQAWLDSINAQQRSMEGDAPELAYYRLRDFSTPPSGVAAQTMLGDLIDRTEEARDHMMAAVVQLAQMAITIAQAIEIPEAMRLGSWEDGALDHEYKAEPIFPLSPSEEFEGELAEIQVWQAYKQMGLLWYYLQDKAIAPNIKRQILITAASTPTPDLLAAINGPMGGGFGGDDGA